MRPVARMQDLMLKGLIKAASSRYKSRSPRLAAVPSEHLGVAIASQGLYERAEIDLVMALVKERSLSDGIMLDIGANIGNHTCALASSFAEIWSFEPNPPVAALLKANIMLNGLSNVRVLEVGLGDADAELSFGVSDAGNDGTGSFARAGSDLTLPVRHADSFIAGLMQERPDSARRISFVKCDVEGYEATTFDGLRRTLATHRPIVMFESGSAELGSAAWKVLKDVGYARLDQIVRPGDSAPNRLMREVARLAAGDVCELRPVAGPGAHECNLIASWV